MSTIEFLVQGSAVEPYRVVFAHDGIQNLTALCSCPAGAMRQYCKHRVAILLGEDVDIVSPNAEQVHTVLQWYQGSDVEAAIHEIPRLETELDTLKKRITKTKKLVAAAMHD